MIAREQLVGSLGGLERLTTPLVLRLLPSARLFPFLISRLVFLPHVTPSGEVAHQVCRQPAVLTVIRTR